MELRSRFSIFLCLFSSMAIQSVPQSPGCFKRSYDFMMQSHPRLLGSSSSMAVSMYQIGRGFHLRIFEHQRLAQGYSCNPLGLTNPHRMASQISSNSVEINMTVIGVVTIHQGHKSWGIWVDRRHLQSVLAPYVFARVTLLGAPVETDCVRRRAGPDRTRQYLIEHIYHCTRSNCCASCLGPRPKGSGKNS